MNLLRVATETMDGVRDSIWAAPIGRRKRNEETVVVEPRTNEDFHSVYVDAGCFPNSFIVEGSRTWLGRIPSTCYTFPVSFSN